MENTSRTRISSKKRSDNEISNSKRQENDDEILCSNNPSNSKSVEN